MSTPLPITIKAQPSGVETIWRRKSGIEAAGVCLLWSVSNPEHELAVDKLVRQAVYWALDRTQIRDVAYSSLSKAERTRSRMAT